MRIALVSLEQLWEDKEGNKAKCSFISETISKVHGGVDLIIYPEMTLTGFSVLNSMIIESIDDSPSVYFFKKLAKKTKCDHIFGFSAKDAKNNYLNRSSYVNSLGELINSYDKMHTFSFAGESKVYSRGNAPTVIDTKLAKIGLSICFDLRFSELYAYYRQYCNLMINIANWPASRKEHWLTLLKARAIENQFFMVGVNRTGMDGNQLAYDYSSVLFDPLGNLVHPILEGDEFSIYDIDISKSDDVRSLFPFNHDLRNELYRNFI